MSNFDRAFNWIISAEGGDSDDPDDPGGYTRFGIAQAYHPEINVPALTKADAERIYRERYWDKVRCDEFPVEVAIALFDGSVNQGPGTAVRLLQRALGVEADGVVGPATIAAARRLPPAEVLLDFLSHRALRYAIGNAKYQRGWFRRLFSLQRAIWGLV